MVAILTAFLAMAAARPLYLSPDAPVDDRVADLLALMTQDEKIAQLILPFGAKFPSDYGEFNVTGLGATYPLDPLPDQQWWETRNLWQTWQVNNTRLGIPTSFIQETLHSGYNGGTIFPMPSLQGNTWDPVLIGEIAQVIAREARVSGVDRGFSPVLHLCTDPRFGRCEESFGEDPGLVAALGVAAVQGLAGPGGPGAASTYLSDPTTQIATEAKHYAAYSAGGRDSAPADISEITLYDVYLRPWRAYAQAGGRSVMAAHNSVNFVPCHGNPDLLTTALRQQFGFAGGLIASDAGDICNIQAFNMAADKMHAGAIAINAGMDQELQFNGCFPLLPQAVAAGLVNQSAIDRAVSNVLRQKIAGGLLDGRLDLLLVDPVKQAAVLANASHAALAYRAAAEGTVLLHNANNFLPLANLAGKTVAIIGPNADNPSSTQGGYTCGGHPIVTVLEGAVTAANQSGNAFTVQYERGACLGGTPDCPCPIPADPTQPPCNINDISRVQVAANLAAASDVTILVLGDSSTIMAGDPTLHHETATCAEHFDRDSLDLPGAQIALLRGVLAASPNVVVVLIHGRTATFGASFGDGFNAMFLQSSAVLAAWRPGQEAGNAIWSIINGTVNPSGRTAHTWPRTVGQVHQYVPWFTPNGARPATDAYGDLQPATPLVPFGYGLSYTNYTITAASLSSTSVPINGSVILRVTVTSVGPAGKLVIQVYYGVGLAARARYAKTLWGFLKADIPANTTGTTVELLLQAQGLDAWDPVAKMYSVVAGPGYHLWVGQYSGDPASKVVSFAVVP